LTALNKATSGRFGNRKSSHTNATTNSIFTSVLSFSEYQISIPSYNSGPVNTPDLNDLNYLLPKTRQVLLDLADFEWLKDFTFVGGSGLSLYLHHRLSEDIDLFTWKAKLNKFEILKHIEKRFGTAFSIQQDTQKQLDLDVQGVKVTFFANDWDALRDNTHFSQNLYLANLDLLAGMKVNTLFLRARFRDYYDLYALNLEGFPVSEMYAIIERLMPGINRRLFQMAMIYTDDVEDDNINHLKPRYKLTKQEIAAHFRKEIDQWLFS
jgi:hypothetical protein